MSDARTKKNNGISAGNTTVRKSSAYSNDIDKSFFSYLNDLKKFEINDSVDRDELLWKIDCAMGTLREIIFSFAPAVIMFLELLEEQLNSGKLNFADIFLPSSLRQLPDNDHDEFFRQWHDSISKKMEQLKDTVDETKRKKLRNTIARECCLLNVNHDNIELFFNRISDYLCIWNENHRRSIREYFELINSFNDEQISVLSEKFLIPPQDIIISLQALIQAKNELISLRHQILKNHLRLVISVAKKFRNRGVSFNDIVQDGNLGLMRAIDKFDPRLGHKFSTYAVWWIKQNIIHGIAEQSRTIRIPAHMLNLITKINNTEQNLLQSLGREPDSAEIAEVLGLTVAKVNAVRCMASQAISLQSPVSSQNENFSLEDILKDNTDSRDFTDFDKDVTYKMLYKLLKTLTKREQEIIIMRFGLFGHRPAAFTELSEHFHLTRERVRQLEIKILNKLRAPDKIQLLDYFFSNSKNRS